MKENTAPVTRAAPKGNHVVSSRAAEAKESVIHHSNVHSCPVKKTAPALVVRKLSLGGGVGVKPKAVGEVGVGNAEAGSRILVFVRLRPMSRKEKEAGLRNCVKIVNKKDVYLTEFASEIDYLRLKRMRGRHFCFDTSFPDLTITSDLLEGVLQGRNGTVFCYGATGAGRTYTMLRTMENPGVMVTVFCYRATGAGKTYTMLRTMENPGVVVLAMKDLFSTVRQRSHDGNHSIQLSYLEVYNETVRDLLHPGRPLLLREDKQGIVAAGLTHYRAYSTDEFSYS